MLALKSSLHWNLRAKRKDPFCTDPFYIPQKGGEGAGEVYADGAPLTVGGTLGGRKVCARMRRPMASFF